MIKNLLGKSDGIHNVISLNILKSHIKPFTNGNSLIIRLLGGLV